MRRRLLAVLALASALSGCAPYYYGVSPSPPPPAPPTPRRPPIDACGAGSLQYLMGRPVSEIPPYGRRERRVIGQSSYAEGHYDPDRLTIIFDENNGRITRVRCG
ncbi:MAG: hypothetical protein M3N05_07145 [Pseudomonadota bacterium]|jgi:hypothetical protein|nr:hypothetical protein [Pseudomonadota bacterium]